MLGGPFRLRPGAVVVGPYNFVLERLASEDCVKKHLAVMRLPVVYVKEETSVALESAPCLQEARLKESQVVVENVGVFLRAEFHGPVALPLEPSSVAELVLDGGQSSPALDLARVERGVDVDEVYRVRRQTPQDRQVVPEVDCQIRHIVFSLSGLTIKILCM